MSLITTVGPLGAVTGYAVGGLVLDSLGWPFIFYLNVPVAALVVGCVLSRLPRDGSLSQPERSLVSEAALLVSATVLLLGGMSLGASHGAVPWAAVTALTLVPAGVWWGSDAGHRLRELFAAPGLRAPHASLLAETTAYGMVLFLLPFYLQRTQELPHATVGLVLLALPVATMVASPVGGVLTDRIGARPVAVAGALGLSAALGLTAPLSPSWTEADVVWRLALIGLGAGIFAGANQTMSMTAAPADRLASVGASTSLARQLGFALGPALATATWAAGSYQDIGMTSALALATGASLLASVAAGAGRVRRPARLEHHLT